MQELNFKLTADDTNTILHALSSMPYGKVFQIINKIQEQAGKQVKNGPKNTKRSPGRK